MTDNDPAYAGLRALRARLAALESLATQPPPQSLPESLLESLQEHYAGDDEAKSRARALASWGPFQPDPQQEQALAARAKDPDAYDDALARMGGDSVGQSIYSARRDAAIKCGEFTPKEGTE